VSIVRVGLESANLAAEGVPVAESGGTVDERATDRFGTTDASSLEASERLEGLVIESYRDRLRHRPNGITNRDT